MEYSIYFNRDVKKFLERLDRLQKERIKTKLLSLSRDPFIGDVKKVQGRENVYRVRIGDFRVLYLVNHEEKEIYVVKIDKRSRVYRK
ncbi:MAG TPA: type II toxin-antitoxin system RelE/ParE family toxin [Candidatus Syntrophoarchaeum butanivorans]|uniref:Type II toxin-antitoxin system RelE/ParE family toxin n=1 Tax=Candidatus Syntropharchaeum butanivorans TaxID=1839936 RepID=A0A7J2S0H4_9EURY|nr:type II toxin-antitoxin system RelE/ParE family toxin [Candidatus Syntrophoarchaeum butanivorans]